MKFERFEYEILPDDSAIIIGFTTENNSETIEYLVIPEEVDGHIVTRIGNNAFEGCDGLEKISIPENLLHIGESAFSYCTDLKHITIPGSLETLGAMAFAGCRYLEEISLPHKVTVINTETFSYCESLTDVTLSKHVINIAKEAFYECEQLTNISFINGTDDERPSENNYQGLKEIGENAFYQCGSLISIDIPFGIEKIGECAFRECCELTNIIIPESVVEMDEYAFCGCEKLSKVLLPDKLKTIGGYAFESCSNLPEIIIPNSVYEIGNAAFDGCSKLKSATLPKGIREIPFALFNGCKKLKTVKIPESVTLIGGSAFSHCSSLTALDIPVGVTHIGESAFAGTGKLVIRIAKNSHEDYCKIRNINYTYYETDSSLDCFNLVIRLSLKDGKVIKFIGEGGVKKGDREYHELFVSCSPADCGECESIDELVQTFHTSVVQGLDKFFYKGEEPGELAVFNEDSPFIKDIRKLESMNEIKTITINSDLWSAGKHNYKHYTYYMDSKETVYDHGGVKINIHEVGGESHIMQYPEFIKGENQGQAIVEDHKGYDADVPMPAVITRGFW